MENTANFNKIQSLLHDRPDVKTAYISETTGIPLATVYKLRNTERHIIKLNLDYAIKLTALYDTLNN